MKLGPVNAVIGMLSVTVSITAWCQDTADSVERAPESLEVAAAQIEAMEPAVDVSSMAPPLAQTVPVAARAPVAPSTGRVMDSLDLGTTSITGNQELPKVLYIVPWKRSDLGDLVGRPVNTLLDEVLAPVDPEVFERHLEYYDTLNGVIQEE